MTDCPTGIELDQALSVGADHTLRRHLESCASCKSWWTETQRAIELARELPVDVPPSQHRQEQRTALLAVWDRTPTIPTPPTVTSASRSRRWILPLVSMVAAAVAILVLSIPSGPSPQPAVGDVGHGVVHPHAGAVFTLAARSPDEIVRLRDGVIDVDVSPLTTGERFRVVVGTDEIEVHGTSFQVTAAGDRLLAVHVVHGRVEVKRGGATATVLDAGESWQATLTASIPSIAAPPVAPRVAPATPRRPPMPTPLPLHHDPQEGAFVSGWEAMRRGELETAAVEFSRAVALAPQGPLAGDATFWHAVTIARVGRSAEAVVALRGFLATYPTSARVGEASAMLGWMLVDAHELEEARRRFQAAVDDPQPSVQASGRQGLELLDKPAR